MYICIYINTYKHTLPGLFQSKQNICTHVICVYIYIHNMCTLTYTYAIFIDTWWPNPLREPK